jgi:hypothetical protein
MCFVVLIGAFLPRVALVLWWLFGDHLSVAYDSFLLAFLGFLFLPYTTLMYALAYAPFAGVTGLGWFLVVLAFLVDLSNIFGGAREGGRRRLARA